MGLFVVKISDDAFRHIRIKDIPTIRMGNWVYWQSIPYFFMMSIDANKLYGCDWHHLSLQSLASRNKLPSQFPVKDLSYKSEIAKENIFRKDLEKVIKRKKFREKICH